ncbi:Atp-dependent dna helicase pif1 [Thalictrum thalictroides]|uniref:Atp-dependent dna helicase pif1 n=1 Tax=Thalictrum thalictroides TaxID=46969 RepID=A0A7J6URB5_THATH|nr:Atp-dependent dna helicase pif1 [Thalictrum thalictroides]
MAIDATYGTNSAGCDLFAVLAEFDGTGVPLAYLFLEKSMLTQTSTSVAPSKMTQILHQFLSPLLNRGFSPSFFACDKDRSEINAIQQVWPSAKVQLCYWHAKRAIQTKLKDCHKTDSLTSYFPEDAKKLVPNLEICWGSYVKNRTEQQHRPEQWELWARSHSPEEIPVLRTTMIVESHWRRIKRDFLCRFNRPRIDLVVWTLISRSIPQGLEKMEAIQDGNYRKGVASWRKKFKQQWKKFASQGTDNEALKKYYTDAAAWTCGCEAFLLSRFLLCKHIVHCYRDFKDPNKFFQTVRRQRSSPFWIQPQLTLRPEFLVLNDLSRDTVFESTIGSISDFESDEEIQEPVEDDNLVQMEDEPLVTYDASGFLSKMSRLIDIFTEQHSIGNSRFAERLIKQNISNLTLLEEIEQLKRRHTTATTWGQYRNPITMYYQFV